MSPVGDLRLQVYLAQAGLGSRRKCEEFILAGRVKVDGQTAELGSKVSPGARVELDGKPVVRESIKRYVALNKPRGFVSTMSDEMDRPTAAGIIRKAFPERLYNVGRLDQWSCGLLLFTNDGDLTRDLLHPSVEIEKEYLAATDLPLPEGIALQFMRGMELRGIRYRAKFASAEGERLIRIVLTEGKNREVRNLLEAFGLRALELERVRFGPILLGELAAGEFRELSREEVARLKESVQ